MNEQAKAKHTPGPWEKACDYLERDRKLHLEAHGQWHLDQGKLQAAFDGTPQAAAPAMLEALQDLEQAGIFASRPTDSALCSAARRKALAAIHAAAEQR